MFDFTRLSINDSLITECTKLVVDHNKASYKKVALQIPTVEYRFIKSKESGSDDISKEIIAFYERYTTQMYAHILLKDIVKETEYTYDDVALHIDMSTDSIVKLLTNLEVTHTKLLEHTDSIKANADAAIGLFIDYLRGKLSSSNSISHIISTVFICMTQAGLSKANVDESLRPFIPVGVRIIGLLHDLHLVTDADIQTIKLKADQLKQITLGAATDTNVTVNRLQRFGIVPDNGPNQTLQQILKKLFGLDIPNAKNIKSSSNEIEKQLRVAASGSYQGLIINVSPNKDVFFDISGLFKMRRTMGSPGITNSMVQTFDLIKHGSSPSAKSYDLITINVDPKKTQSAYVLWTNDYQTFKVCSTPIYNATIQRIIRGAPSPTIEAFNNLFEQMMDAAHANDSVSYNKVKYMAFTEEMDEAKFLDLLCDKIQKGIEQLIGKLSDNKARDKIIDESFENMLFDILEQAKSKLGVPLLQLPAHCHIIYGNMSVSIVGKLKKQLLWNQSIDKKTIKDSIDLIVRTNDNIYSRIIASYYLHMA